MPSGIPPSTNAHLTLTMIPHFNTTIAQVAIQEML